MVAGQIGVLGLLVLKGNNLPIYSYSDRILNSNFLFLVVVWQSKRDAELVEIRSQHMVEECALVLIEPNYIVVICHHVRCRNSHRSMVHGVKVNKTFLVCHEK